MENTTSQENLSDVVGLFEQLPEEVQEAVIELMRSMIRTNEN